MIYRLWPDDYLVSISSGEREVFFADRSSIECKRNRLYGAIYLAP